MDYVAIRHEHELGTKATSIRLMPSDKVDALLTFARSGDTIHKVPDEVSWDINLLMNHIEQQLLGEQYVRVP